MASQLENAFSISLAAKWANVIKFVSKAHEQIYVCNLWIIFNLKTSCSTELLSLPVGWDADGLQHTFCLLVMDSTLLEALGKAEGTAAPE